MSKFLLENVSPEHHQKCQEKCGRTEGAMLKCMNLQAIGQKPCTNVIHATCAGYDSSVVPHLKGFFCVECTTASDQLHTQMTEIEDEAKQLAANSARDHDSVTKEQYERLKTIAEQLEIQLKEKLEQLAVQDEKIKAQKEASDKQAEEMRQMKASITQLQANKPTFSGGAAQVLSSTIFDRFNETLRRAEGFNNRQQNVNSSINNSTYCIANTTAGWPDYEEQHKAATLLDEHSLLLIRSNIAKPVVFEGDVTKWATFLSEFVRTSKRGHFRDFEDIDRLRDLIGGEAREMFVTELSDPCAEILPTLKRLDDFFGVRGNAVRVALDRLTQLPKIDKANDKQRLKNLYTHSKQFALQCRIHGQDHELLSESSLFIIESKMHNDQSKAWRVWAKTNGKQEDVDGAIAYLEDTVRELSFKGPKPKPSVTTSVNVTENVTGGPDDGGTEPNSPASGSKKSQDNRKSDSNKKGKGKKKNRYAKCECFQCKEKHPFYNCPQLIDANESKRLEIVNRLHVCQRCLCSNKHKIEDCPNKCLKCYISGCTVKNRHPLLHGHSNEALPSFATTTAHVSVNFMDYSCHFAMVPGNVIASDGSRFPITLMFDGGSGISLATHSLFERAKCEAQMEYELTLRWATDVTHTDQSAKLFDLQFLPDGSNKAITLRNLTAVKDLQLPEQSQDAESLKRKYPHLRNIPLPSYRKQVPQILLGLSHAGLMAHLSSVTSESPDDPVAALTQLGWIIYGNCLDSGSRTANRPMILGFTCNNPSPDEEVTNEELLRVIRASNDIESLGISHRDASTLSENDQQAEKIIKSTMKFIPEVGRYEIGLLWRNENDNMPDNYEQALSRLISSENRLKKLNMLEYVNEQFEEQIKNGWLVETTREEANKYPRRNYVYGFLTFNKNKQPPKPRWVNDTAATFKGVSLNTKVLKGPDTLVPLPQSMCALREGRIAFQGDIKSMFNQVLLKEDDQFSQLTLWRNGDQKASPRIYRQTRVIFGPACSPSDTSSVRIDHALKCQSEFPLASDVALHQMYVDDAPDSRDTVEEAAKVANDLIEMFSRIGWPLIEFQSNSQEFLSRLPVGHVSKKMLDVASDTDELITKVLGIFWKPQQDVYVFRLNDDAIIKRCTTQNYQPTKKEMLSTVMRIFDPLGQIAPFRIRGHMIMQHVWRAGTDWKKKPPKDICDEFTKWLIDFQQVTKLEIPRPYSQFPLKDARLTLHIFVDAGTEAYAACAYLHIQHETSTIVRLIAAKAKVAPLKYMSIPRLELMAGLIGARLYKSVTQWHRRLNFNDYFCWTDSDVSFRWIRSHHLPRTPFSAPRIAEIQELTSADKWRYVPSKLNVSDYATKQRDIDYSDANHEWFTGPQFLYESPDKWPKQPSHANVTIEATLAVARISQDKTEESTMILKHISARIRSQWSLLARVIARALRFVDHLDPKRPFLRRHGPFTCHEIERAENYIIRLVQMSVFPGEYESLLKSQTVHKSSQIYSLSPKMCKKTLIIRATTRLSENFPLNMRSPPILPNFHEVSDAIVRHYHHANLHVGDNAIIAQMRSRVWIIHAKRAVRRCRARCLRCIEKRIKPGTPDRADLPDFRLAIHEKPFFHTGCDLFGPFTVYVGGSKRKTEIHVVIFTCMVTRAIYLETLDSKSTSCFLTAFEKFWARRGPIAHMYSDNGLNFVGAARVIKEEQMEMTWADKKITWHFNPAYCPTFGGAWERLIKDIKRGLEASIGRFIAPRLSMEAALAKIEANLNNRPLTEIPISSTDDTPLTPQILMTGYPNYPAMDDSSNKELAYPPDIRDLRPDRQINALVQAFRHRFIAEYAPIITRRPVNSAKAKYMLKLNDYVVYIDSTKNPWQWQRGVIIKTYPGKDFAIRVVDIKLKDGRVLERRPAHLVAKLDIRFDDKEAETQKYAERCNLLVTRNLNVLTKSGNTTEQQSGEQQQQQNLKVKDMDDHSIHCKILDGITFVHGPDVAPENNVKVTDEELAEFIDFSGKKIVLAKNFPPGIGAGDVFAIMAEFGEIKMIATSNHHESQPFSCFVGYEDAASVSTAMLWNESQLVCHQNIVYRQSFERLMKPFVPHKSIHKPIHIFLEMELPIEPNRRVLVITSGREHRGYKPIQATGNCGAFINYCPRTSRYDFSRKEVDLERDPLCVRRLPFVPKDATSDVPGAHAQQGIIDSRTSVRSFASVNGHIQITIANDPFQMLTDNGANREPELPEQITTRREIKKIRSVISKPRRR